MIPFLFGASPAVCKSFFQQTPGWLSEFDDHTYYNPHATSLRMSDVGYKNLAQESLNISYNTLEDYVTGLTRAIETPYPDYVETGVVVDGEYRQLNANILQIENEYYSFVRPKQVAKSGEKPTLALKRRGVQYVEIRALDVDLFDPVGVNENQMRFMEAFLIFCLLQDSPPISADEQTEIDRNQQLVACCGRDTSIKLLRQGSSLALQTWAEEIYQQMLPVADLLDQGETEPLYKAALNAELPAIRDPELTLSAQVLRHMRDNKESFFHFAMNQCEQHNRHFREVCMPPERIDFLDEEARRSLQQQAEIETSDRIPFDQYLQQYFAQS